MHHKSKNIQLRKRNFLDQNKKKTRAQYRKPLKNYSHCTLQEGSMEERREKGGKKDRIGKGKEDRRYEDQIHGIERRKII